MSKKHASPWSIDYEHTMHAKKRGSGSIHTLHLCVVFSARKHRHRVPTALGFQLLAKKHAVLVAKAMVCAGDAKKKKKSYAW
jgi:hypothetical protein